jgi:hypothetical protein
MGCTSRLVYYAVADTRHYNQKTECIVKTQVIADQDEVENLTKLNVL